MFARVLVILFALVVIAIGGAIGYFVLGDSNSILGSGIAQLADPLAPVDPQDNTKQVVTVAPGAGKLDLPGFIEVLAGALAAAGGTRAITPRD